MKLTIKHDDIEADLSYGQLAIGKENGYSPLQLLVSSIAGCSAIVFRTILEKKRITYDTFTIETEIGRSEALSKPVESVHLHYKNQSTKHYRRAVGQGAATCSEKLYDCSICKR